MKNSIAKLLPGMVAGTLLLLGMAAPASAFTGSLRGIDAPTVLALKDQTRRIKYSLNANGPVRSLQHVRTIVIDPGHGGQNSGATGVAGIREKHLTLDLAYTLRNMLQERYPDARIVLTRYWDTHLELHERVHLANLADADLFISLHYNAAVHNRAVGIETYFLSTEAATPGKEQVQGKPVAAAAVGTDALGATGITRNVEPRPAVGLHDDALSTIEADLRRARLHADSGLLAETVQRRLVQHLSSTPNRGVKQANFGVLRGALMPAIVVEAGFLTHPTEGIVVTRHEHRLTVARALVEAIEAFDAAIARRNK